MPKSSVGAFALSPEYIEFLHDQLVALYYPATDEPIDGDEFRDKCLLGSAAGRPLQTAFGNAAYPTTSEKAAALFHSLIANHPFANGNKRTAVVALDLFLYANNRFLHLDEEEMYALAKGTASYRQHGIDHDSWFANIVFKIRSGSVNFNEIRHYRRTHEICLRIKAFVRQHPLNKSEAET